MVENSEQSPTTPITRPDRYRAKLDKTRDELREIEERLEEVEEERAELLARAEKLKTVVEVLGEVCSDLDQDHSTEWADLAKCGIQECCYRVLLESEEPLDATVIRYELESNGVDVSRYANPLAVIHTSLKRIPDRVRSFRRKTRAVNSSAMVWVRYYEAIKPGTGTSRSSKT